MGLSLSFRWLISRSFKCREVEGLVGLKGGVAIYFQMGTTESEIAIMQDWIAQNPELELKEVRSSEKAFEDLMSIISDQTKEPNLLEVSTIRSCQLRCWLNCRPVMTSAA